MRRGSTNITCKAPFFQRPEQRYPVHPRRLHDHGLHTALRQPLRQAIQVCCEGGKLLYRLLCAVGGHRHEMAGGAHVNAGRVQVQLGQFRWQMLPLPCSLARPFRTVQLRLSSSSPLPLQV